MRHCLCLMLCDCRLTERPHTDVRAGNCDCGHRSGKALTDFDDQLAAIKCAHCGNKNLYRWSARSEQNYTPKSVET
jgi:hypothetical protein